MEIWQDVTILGRRTNERTNERTINKERQSYSAYGPWKAEMSKTENLHLVQIVLPHIVCDVKSSGAKLSHLHQTFLGSPSPTKYLQSFHVTSFEFILICNGGFILSKRKFTKSNRIKNDIQDSPPKFQLRIYITFWIQIRPIDFLNFLIRCFQLLPVV